MAVQQFVLRTESEWRVWHSGDAPLERAVPFETAKIVTGDDTYYLTGSREPVVQIGKAWLTRGDLGRIIAAMADLERNER